MRAAKAENCPKLLANCESRANRYTAVLDTCVLAPMPLCDSLLRLAEDPAFYIPRWTGDILRELRSTLLRMGYDESQAARRIPQWIPPLRVPR